MSRSLDCSLDYARDDIARDDKNALHDAVNKKKETESIERFDSVSCLNAAASYSPTWSGSTIGVGELNFSVRYG